jgi:hypothetical protein
MPVQRPENTLRRGIALARLALKGVLAGLMRDLALASFAALLALAGVGCLLAAGFGLLAHLIGVIPALALTGLALLALAGLVFLLRRTEPEVIVLSEPATGPIRDPVPDPMAQMIFDLSFRLGRELTRTRD